MGKCEACPTVTESLESHHVVPVAYGGRKSGLQVLICSNCHAIITKCTENPELPFPPHLTNYVKVARLAKQRHAAGELEARDRRPTTLIPMNPQIEEQLAYLSRVFNTRSRVETIITALTFAATHAGRVK